MASPAPRVPRGFRPGPLRASCRALAAGLLALGALGPAGGAAAATYRDELTFLGKTSSLLREYALVVPLDVKRQPLPGQVFLEIKAWGAWNGSWVPYVYEALDVPGAAPDDLNGIIGRYRQGRRETHLDIQKRPDNSFVLTHEKGRSRFDLRTKGLKPRVVLENPEGRLELGVAEAELELKGHRVAGRVACVMIAPGRNGGGEGRYGLYDHFTLQLPSGAILVVYHSRNRPGYNLTALMTPDGRGDRQGRAVQVAWRRPWSDGESGRSIPSAWTVGAAEVGIKVELEEWGRNLVRYTADGGKIAVFLNAMVRGWAEVDGSRYEVYGLNTHVQDE